jgi:orotidine-5'-phosphate decarboxylase
VHAFDRKTLDAAVRGRGDSALKLLGVTVLTNLSASDLVQQGIDHPLREVVLHRAKLAKEAGFDGVIASGHEAASIRKTAGADFLIVTPGVRPRGAPVQDQARAVTPLKAIAAGADYLVVGRPITRAPDPRAAAEAIVAEIAAALTR